MFLTLDNLAKRYGCLPSEALRRADTLDLYVLDLGGKWTRHQQEQQEGHSKTGSTKKLSKEVMLAMLERARSEKIK